MSIIDTLTTDRAEADWERVKSLNAKGWEGMTAAEREEWLAGLKGSYNATDLNRVESAVSYLASLMRGLPDELKTYAASKGVAWDVFFDVPYNPDDYELTVKTNWVRIDIPSVADMKRYLNNVVLLKSALTYATDDLPESMDKLTWQGANAIEKALEGLDAAIAELRTVTKTNLDNTAASWFYSGEIYANEVI